MACAGRSCGRTLSLTGRHEKAELKCQRPDQKWACGDYDNETAAAVDDCVAFSPHGVLNVSAFLTLNLPCRQTRKQRQQARFQRRFDEVIRYFGFNGWTTKLSSLHCGIVHLSSLISFNSYGLIAENIDINL